MLAPVFVGIVLGKSVPHPAWFGSGNLIGATTDTHTEKLVVVGCAPPEGGHPLCNLKTQHLYYIHSKEEAYMLVTVGDLCKGTISGCSHPGGGGCGC